MQAWGCFASCVKCRGQPGGAGVTPHCPPTAQQLLLAKRDEQASTDNGSEARPERDVHRLLLFHRQLDGTDLHRAAVLGVREASKGKGQRPADDEDQADNLGCVQSGSSRFEPECCTTRRCFIAADTLAQMGKRLGASVLRAIGDVERVRGIEPLSKAWEAAVLPLNYTRNLPTILAPARGAKAPPNRLATNAQPTLATSITITNAPRQCPVLSGELTKPFYCATPTPRVVNGSVPASNASGLSGAPDENCNIASEFKLYYRSTTAGCSLALPDPTPAMSPNAITVPAMPVPPANACF